MWERTINWLLPIHTWTGDLIWPRIESATQVCALTGNWTCNLLVTEWHSKQLSHNGQDFYNSWYYSGVSFCFSSFISGFIYLAPLFYFVFMSLAKGLSVLFTSFVYCCWNTLLLLLFGDSEYMCTFIFLGTSKNYVYQLLKGVCRFFVLSLVPWDRYWLGDPRIFLSLICLLRGQWRVQISLFLSLFVIHHIGIICLASSFPVWTLTYSQLLPVPPVRWSEPSWAWFKAYFIYKVKLPKSQIYILLSLNY